MICKTTNWQVLSSGAPAGSKSTEFLKHCFYCHCQVIGLFSAALKWSKTKELHQYNLVYTTQLHYY